MRLHFLKREQLILLYLQVITLFAFILLVNRAESIALLSKNVNSCSRKRLHAFDSAQNFSKIHANYFEISYFDSYFDFFYRFQTPKKHDYDIFSRIKSFQARHGGLIFQFLLKSCVSKSARHADLCFLYMCDHIPIQIE